MKTLRKARTLTLELNEDEINFLRNYTQNYLGDDPTMETEEETAIRLRFFVHSSRALGISMEDDGSIGRNHINYTMQQEG